MFRPLFDENRYEMDFHGLLVDEPDQFMDVISLFTINKGFLKVIGAIISFNADVPYNFALFYLSKDMGAAELIFEVTKLFNAFGSIIQ